MANKTRLISDTLFEDVGRCLKDCERYGDISYKLQAIISAKTHGIKAVAEIFGVSRKSVMSWIKRFSEESSAGLMHKSGKGRKQLINNDIKNDIREILLQSPNTTILQVQKIIIEKHHVNSGYSTVHRMIKSLHLSYITPRPKHYKADASKQEAFKKNS